MLHEKGEQVTSQAEGVEAWKRAKVALELSPEWVLPFWRFKVLTI
jgi:hypothetical protein